MSTLLSGYFGMVCPGEAARNERESDWFCEAADAFPAAAKRTRLGGSVSGAVCIPDALGPVCHNDAASGDWIIFDGRLDEPEAPTGGAPARALAAYRTWGADCPRYLIGDYAFALWDARRATLFAARDPAQSRPLYYAVDGPRFLFASDPRLLLKAGIAPGWDHDYLTTYMVLANLNGERTPYAAIRQIPGGHSVEASRAGVQVRQWWQLPEAESLRYRRNEEYEEHLRVLLRQAVQARLRTARGPVAVALSRGIDSAAIAATAQGLLRDGDAACSSVEAITIALPDYPEGDESRDATRIAAHLKMPQRVVNAQPHPADIVPLLSLLPEPSGLPDRYNLWEPVRDACAARDCRVLLTGAGGEAFTSPPYYLADLWRTRRFPMLLREMARWTTGMPLVDVLQTLLRGLQQPSYDWTPEKRLPRYPWLLRPERCKTDLHSQSLPHPVLRDSYYACIEAGQVTPALQPLFRPAGVELRNPLLDRRIVEFAYSLPVELRLRRRLSDGRIRNKPLLRAAFAAEVPLALTQTNAHLRKYSGHAQSQTMSAFRRRLDCPPDGFAEVVDIDVLRSCLSELQQDRGEKRYLALTTVLADWLAAMEASNRPNILREDRAHLTTGRR
jgi:asparagine synthase (glutamine-hydrolysing)